MKNFINNYKTSLILAGIGSISLFASYAFICGAHNAPPNSIVEAFFGIPGLFLCLFGSGCIIASGICAIPSDN